MSGFGALLTGSNKLKSSIPQEVQRVTPTLREAAKR
jgi:hypothetical protein